MRNDILLKARIGISDAFALKEHADPMKEEMRRSLNDQEIWRRTSEAQHSAPI